MYRNKRQTRTQTNKCEKSNKGIKKRTRGKEAPRGGASVENKTSKIITRSTAKHIRDEKITSRVTVPLDFFSQGVKSKTVRKDAKDCNSFKIKEQDCHLLNEDLHALLRTVSVSSTEQSPDYVEASNSTHINPNVETRTHFGTVSDYYVKLESQQVQKHHKQANKNENGDRNSVFKEINSRYREATAKHDITENVTKSIQTFGYNLAPKQLKTDKINLDYGCFCKQLKEQLGSITLTSRRVRCYKRITTLVAEINTVLEGHEISPSKIEIKPPNKRKIEQNVPNAISKLIPKSNWLYKTPNGQKVRRPVVSSSTIELKPCILQAGIDSKVVFEFNTTNTANLDFLAKNFDTYNSPNTSISDVDNISLNGSSNFIENFKIPTVDLNASRNVMSLFSNNTIPLFEDIKDPFPKTFKHKDPFPKTFKHKDKTPVPRRPGKTTKNIIRDNIGTSRCLAFGKVAKRQKIYQKDESKENIFANCVARSQKNEIPATVTSKNYFQSLSQLDCSSSNKENYQPCGLSNHPRRNEAPLNETFIIDEKFLLPTLPNLSDPQPLPFYPRTSFGKE